MNTFKRFTFLFMMMVAILSASGCTSMLTPATATPTPPPPTDTPTPAPTRTPIPTNTPTPTITPSPTITQTPTADVGTDFSKARVLRHGKVQYWNYFVTLELPEAPKGDFYAIANLNKNYTCTQSTKFPKQITCVGQMVAYDNYFDFDLYLKDYPTVLFKTRIYVPAE